MDISEKVSYLKGLMEGLDYNEDTKEAKIIRVMAEILEDIADEIEDIECDADEVAEYVESLDEDLSVVEDELFGCDDDCDCDCDCDCCQDDDSFEIVCPECNRTIVFEEVPEDNKVVCPSCGKEIPLE